MAAKPVAGLTLPAEIKPLVEAPIYARASGYLKQYLVDMGAPVKEGDVLAEIDTPELNQELAQARAQLLQAQAAVELARTTATLRRLRLADLAPGGLRELASRDAGGAGPVVRSSPGEVAYILYTSGSTGEPKGISTSTCPSSTSSSA